MNEQRGPWIKLVKREEASPELIEAIGSQAGLYPIEYAEGVESLKVFHDDGASIISSHTLIPQALYHAFATYGTLLSPDLPLTRKQHEMIAATVSSINACHY